MPSSSTVRFHFFGLDRQTHQRVPCAAVFPHIDQSFLHNAQNLATHTLRHVQVFQVSDESRADSGLPLKSFDRVIQNPEQPLRVDVNGFHLLHQFPQLEHFFAQQPLNST